MQTKKAVLATAVALGAFVVGAALVAGMPLSDGWEPPEPEIESVEVVRAGCHDDVRGMSMTSTDGTWIGTVNGTSPHTELSAEIRHTSPERADVTTYSIDAETHNTSAPAPGYDCDAGEGAVRYRLQYDAPSPDGTTGRRVTRYLNGELWGCGGSTSGPDLGCARIHQDVPTRWSNGSGQ